MTRRDIWVAVALVLVAAVLYLAFPRYEWRGGGSAPLIRIDRWTGEAVAGRYTQWTGAWRPYGTTPDATSTLIDSFLYDLQHPVGWWRMGTIGGGLLALWDIGRVVRRRRAGRIRGRPAISAP